MDSHSEADFFESRETYLLFRELIAEHAELLKEEDAKRRVRVRMSRYPVRRLLVRLDVLQHMSLFLESEDIDRMCRALRVFGRAWRALSSLPSPLLLLSRASRKKRKPADCIVHCRTRSGFSKRRAIEV